MAGLEHYPENKVYKWTLHLTDKEKAVLITALEILNEEANKQNNKTVKAASWELLGILQGTIG